MHEKFQPRVGGSIPTRGRSNLSIFPTTPLQHAPDKSASKKTKPSPLEVNHPGMSRDYRGKTKKGCADSSPIRSTTHFPKATRSSICSPVLMQGPLWHPPKRSRKTGVISCRQEGGSVERAVKPLDERECSSHLLRRQHSPVCMFGVSISGSYRVCSDAPAIS